MVAAVVGASEALTRNPVDVRKTAANGINAMEFASRC
jgi:hypothetical protein